MKYSSADAIQIFSNNIDFNQLLVIDKYCTSYDRENVKIRVQIFCILRLF